MKDLNRPIASLMTGLGIGLGSIGLGMGCLGLSALAQPQNRQLAVSPTLCGAMSTEILAAHNKYRTVLGIPSLTWSNTLASGAQQWANQLAARGGRQLVHSDRSQRSGQGENLWLGTAGAFSYTRMVDGWGAEKQYFKRGTFPDVSSTGNWADVGHYTQIIWRKTTQVGCATARAGGNDILVCRYSPAGNFLGQPVY